MNFTRRDFLKTTGLACGVAAFPGWVVDSEAAEAAAVDRHALDEIALDRAKKAGASYADIRINRYRTESISAREQRIQSVSRSQDFGFGVRVLLNGAWGFAARYVVTPESVGRVTEQAIDIARANAAYSRRAVEMAAAPKVTTSWRSAFVQDPFDVPVDRKIEFLLKLNGAALKPKGANFLTPDKTGKLEFGPKLCNFYADRTQPQELATVGYDDEGVQAESWALVNEGIFVDWQTTRDLAPLVGLKRSHGCLHADNWGSVPFLNAQLKVNRFHFTSLSDAI